MFFLAVIFTIMFITHLRDFFFFFNRGINEFRLHIITSKALVSNKPIWATGDFLPLYEAKQQLQKHISVIVLFSSWLKSWVLRQPVIFAYNKWLLICIVRATPLTRNLFRSQMLSTDTSSLLSEGFLITWKNKNNNKGTSCSGFKRLLKISSSVGGKTHPIILTSCCSGH